MSHCSTLKTLLLVIGLLCFSSSIFSQTQKEPKFGKIKLSQLQKEKDDKFPDAHAVVLFDYGVSYYRYDAVSRTLKLNYERHTAIQFFDNTKFDLATFEIPLYHVSGHGETLRKIKAYTYNIVDGEMERTKFSKKDIVKEKITDYLDKKKFTLTNVKEGSIIEVKYSVASDFATYMKPWYFQRKVPVRYSEYNIDVPEFFIFNKSMSGYFAPYIKPVKKNSRNDYLMISQGWAMKNLPAFEEERYMRSYKNYISKIEFELRSIRYPWGEVENLIKSWEDIRDDLYRNGDFGKEIKKGKKVESIVEQFKEGSEKERMVAIYEYVKTHMKWNGRKSEMSYQGVKKSLEKAEGTSGDINILLAAALRKAGFKVTPVILSTRDNGMLPYAPTVRKINYMIVKVDIGDKTFYLDATDDFFPAGLLPIRCFNGNAIILGEKETKKVEVKPTFGKKFVTQNILNLEEDGVLKGVIKKTKSGYAALDFREEYSEATDEDAFVEDLQNKTEGLTIESHEIENIGDVYKGIKEKYEVTLEDKLEVAGDLIYLNPMIGDGFVSENPFKLENRKYPVDYAVPVEQIYLLKIAIPEGYQIEFLPEEAIYVLPDKAAKFTYSAKVAGKDLTIVSRFKINKTIFIESEYNALKEFYNLVVKKHAEQVVLKKI